MQGHPGHVPESFWRSLKHLDGFRLFLTLFFVATALSADRWHLVSTRNVSLFLQLGITYGVVLGGLALLLRRWHLAFEVRLTLPLLADIFLLTLLMHVGGGIETGLGLVLIVPLAGAGMYAETRAMLFMASLATLAVLTEHALSAWGHPDMAEGFARAGMLSVGFFTVAGLSHLLAKSAQAATRLAGEKARQAASLERINERVIRDLPYGVAVVDGDGRLLQANPQAAQMLACPLGRRGDLQTCVPELARAWRRWRDTGEGQSQLFRAGGEGRRLRASLSALDPDGEQGAVIVIEDMTELEQQAMKLKLAALGRLTANLAHEIRNPLSAINHAAQLLAEDLGRDAQSARLTRIIEDNVKRLNWLVEDVLALNRRDRVDREAIDLARFLEDFLAQFQQSEGLAPGVAQLIMEDALVLCCDRLHLHQILWNLCRNARRHASGASGSIQIRVRATLDSVQLDVYNDGPSIDPELQLRLFEPFYTTDKAGTGLGLYIARELAEANGAELRCLPQDAGALFRLSGRLPPC